jgi:hypothetical protein
MISITMAAATAYSALRHGHASVFHSALPYTDESEGDDQVIADAASSSSYHEKGEVAAFNDIDFFAVQFFTVRENFQKGTDDHLKI